MSASRYELLWWSGCPSHGDAYELFASVLHEAGEDPARIVRLQMVTMEDAADEGFVGSPTIRVDGRDVDPPDEVVPALTCRVYFSADGRPRPLPDREKIVAAVRRARA
ncbi:MAG: hypothetical protein QM626_01065 [Microbacterium sp.]|uniref:hypothetical protein n=1 Tax=Microbacterium sp. TaxID=51671 RepID=UPI0039E55E16